MYKKLNLISLGCDKNRVDSEEILYNLCGLDIAFVEDIADAQIVIINTCAFIESARKEAIDTILSVASLKNSGLEMLVVTGCLPQKHLSELKDELPEVDCFLQVGEYGKIAQAILDFYNAKTNSVIASVDKSGADQIGLKGIKADGKGFASGGQATSFRRILTTPDFYAYLKIADGCDNHCTFCTIPSIRGVYVSKPIEQLSSEVEELTKHHAVREIILVAQDVTSYGKDLYGSYKLIDLIRELSRHSIEKIRLMYCYPELITDSLIEEISTNPKVAKYIDIPLQHVDDDILKLMNRRSNFESIKNLIQRVRKIDREIAIRTTFMVGFPGETDAHFERLFRFLQDNPLEHVGIFAYSFEDDTPSAKLSGHVSDDIKLERVQRLGELHKIQTEQKNREKIGTKLRAVYFDIDYDRNMFVARSEFDAPDIDSLVYFTSATAVDFGEEYEITITDINGFDLIGEVK